MEKKCALCLQPLEKRGPERPTKLILCFTFKGDKKEAWWCF